jgi:Leucine-rich repeat (LRR) protein
MFFHSCTIALSLVISGALAIKWEAAYDGYAVFSVAATHSSQTDPHPAPFAAFYRLIAAGAKSNVPPSEINALYVLYNVTDGPHWHWVNSSNGFSGVPWNFSGPCNPCADEWQGILCTSTELSGYLNVMAIKLDGLGLRGQLPDNFDQFTQLEAFQAPNNYLTGTFPESFGNISTLLLLNVGYNQISGSFPAELGNATTLKVVNMNDNLLSGSLPEFFANMPGLMNLVLDSNFLTGPVPSSFGTLVQLTTLNLGDNILSGHIPPSLGDLVLMGTLVLNQNWFSGLFPDISRMAQLQYIYLDYNGFSGPMPAYLGDLSLLEYITMNENYFTGTVPAALSNSVSLQNLYLHTNHLTGTVPPELGQISTLLLLDLHHNKLTGTLPAELGNLRKLTVMNIYTNFLTGSLPPQLGQLSALQTIDLSQNYITGTLPRTLCYLQQLVFLKIHEVQVRGPIPDNIGNMTSLSYLSLHDNHMTSSVPSGLKQLPFLNSLFIFNNMFTGSISQFINPTVQKFLAIVQISGNRLTGQIPDDLFRLPELQTVIIGDNCFHGSLPETMCNASQATTLSLDGLRSGSTCRDVMFPGSSTAYVLTNHIRGGIPRCLFEMKWLNTLHLSGNGLTGRLPDDVDISVNLVDLSLSHNKLTGRIPKVFQQRVWYNFDLSYNKFQGTLTRSFATVLGNLTVLTRLGLVVVNASEGEFYNPRGAVTLRNNRLSNTIPAVVQSMQNVTVLQGNLFGCQLNQKDLPQQDDGRFTYNCGSNSFNISYYIYLSVLLVVLCALATVYYFRAETTAFIDTLTTMQTLRKWFAVVDLYDNDSGRGKSRLHRYKYVVLLFDEVCRIAAWCTLYIVAVMMPLYSALSRWYGTHQFEYAWSVSAAFMSGAVALSLELVFFCGMLALLLTLYKLLLRTMKRFLHSLPKDFHFSVLDNFQDDEEAVINKYSSLTEKITVYFVFFLINVTVVGAANIGYVFAAIYAGTSYQILAQFGLSLFKLLWNNFGSIYLIRWTHHYLASSASKEWKSKGAGFFAIQLFVQLFNYIVVPCIVVAAMNPDCFNNTVVASTPVTAYFYYEQCSLYSALFGCLATKTSVASTTYDPPFTYSYECSSSLITFYAPTFVYLGFIVTFVSPFWNAFMRWVHINSKRGTRWFAVVDFWVPLILHPVSADTVQYDKPYDIFNPYIDANYVLVTIVAYLGVLLTFGFVFPPVAVVMLCAIVSTVYVSRIEVGRFLSDAIADGVHKYTDIIETECQGVGSLPKLIQGFRIVAIFSCLFYTPFLFDTLGDSVGIKGCFWVAIVVPLLPLLIHLGHRAYQLCYSRLRSGGGVSRAGTAVSVEMRISEFMRSTRAQSLAEEAQRSEKTPEHDMSMSGLQNIEMGAAAAEAMRLSSGAKGQRVARRDSGSSEAEGGERGSSTEGAGYVFNVLQQP